MAESNFEKRLREFGALPPLEEPATPANGQTFTANGAVTGNYFLVALADECNAMASTAVNRNDRLNIAALKLGSLIAPSEGVLTAELVTDNLTAAAREASGRGDHPLTDDEIAATIKSGLNAGMATPRVIVQRARRPGVIEVVNGYEGGDVGGQKPDPTPGFDAIVDIEEDFWESRDSLALIYQAALARMCSPWAVFGLAVAQALAVIPPSVKLPPLIGGPGSLNWFVALVAASGGGKGAARAALWDILPDGAFNRTISRNLGSGEGLVTAYQIPKGDPEYDLHQDGLRTSVLFEADEIDTVAALGSRTGSTLMSMLRMAYSGETLGYSYATRGRDIHLIAGTYRLCLICAVQPSRAGALLDEAGGGTPQRFMWLPASDRRIIYPPPDMPEGRLEFPDIDELVFRGTVRLGICPEAQELILTERVKAMRGETGALDGHALFSREKLAYGLAVLDGRANEITSEDWRLSGIAARVSDHPRAEVIAIREAEQLAEAVEAGRLRGRTNAAAAEERIRAEGEKAAKVKARVLKRVAQSGAEGIGRREIARWLGRDYIHLGTALASLIGSGHIAVDDATGIVTMTSQQT